MSMIQYNTPIVQEAIEMTGRCKVMTAEVRADAQQVLAGSMEHFRGGGAEGFQGDYQAEMTKLDHLEEMIGRAEQALAQGLDGMMQKDALIKSSYGG